MQFDIEALRARAGEKRFARAVGYVEDGAVDILGLEAGAVAAHVRGERTYFVEMADPEGRDARCGCPDAQPDGSPVCKHMVAVAMTVNEMPDSALQRAAGRMARLRETLEFDDRDALIERLVTLAKRHPAVLAELESD